MKGRTGEELKTLFPSLTETVKEILYINQDLSRIKLNDANISELELDRNHNNSIHLTTFYFEESKCFTFCLSFKLNSISFSLMNLISPLSISLHELNPDFHYSIFITDYFKHTFQNPFEILNNELALLFFGKLTIKIDPEYLIQKFISRLIKKGDLISFENQLEYFQFLMNKFNQEKNLTTTKLPLYEMGFKYKIDNEAFMKFYEDHFLKTEDKISLLSHTEKGIFKTISYAFQTINSTALRLHPLFLENVIEYQNRFTLNDAVLYIGTIISFWLNTCYCDLIKYFKQLIKSRDRQFCSCF